MRLANSTFSEFRKFLIYVQLSFEYNNVRNELELYRKKDGNDSVALELGVKLNYQFQ